MEGSRVRETDGAEDTAAGALSAHLPSGLFHLGLERSSLPLLSLTFRGWFYLSLWFHPRLCLITSSRKPSLLPKFRCPSSVLTPGIIAACSPSASLVPPTPRPLRSPRQLIIAPYVTQLLERGE